jgi:transposase
MAESESAYTFYTPEFKEKVVLEYEKGVRGKGYGALAVRFKIDDSKALVKRWVEAYDGTLSSLAKHHGGEAEPALQKSQRDVLVRQFVNTRARVGLHTGREEISRHIEEKTGLELSPNTISKYTADYNITPHRVHKQAASQGNPMI